MLVVLLTAVNKFKAITHNKGPNNQLETMIAQKTYIKSLPKINNRVLYHDKSKHG